MPNPSQFDLRQLTLSFSGEEDDVGRNRGQRVTRNNPYRKGAAWMFRWREDVRGPDGTIERQEFKRKIAEAKGPEAIGKHAADKIARDEILGPLAARERRPGSLATVREFYEAKYVPEVMPHFKRRERANKASLFRAHILDSLGDVRMRDVTVLTVKRLLNRKLAAGLSVQRVRHIRNAISSLFRYAREERFFTGEMPTEFRWRVKMARVRPRGALSFAQAFLLMEAFATPGDCGALSSPATHSTPSPATRSTPSPATHLTRSPATHSTPSPATRLSARRAATHRKLAVFVRFLFVTGARLGEAVGLRWRHLNLTEETVTVGALAIPPRSAALVEAFVAGEWTTVKGEAAHERIVPLPADLVAALAGIRPDAASAEDPVFASSTGKPLDGHNYLRSHLKPAVAAVNAVIGAVRAGELEFAREPQKTLAERAREFARRGVVVQEIPAGFSWHWMRHANASYSNQARMSAVDRRKLLGHAADGMTMRYSHAFVDEARPGIEWIAAQLRGGGAAVEPGPGPEGGAGGGKRLAEVLEFSRREVG